MDTAKKYTDKITRSSLTLVSVDVILVFVDVILVSVDIILVSVDVILVFCVGQPMRTVRGRLTNRGGGHFRVNKETSVGLASPNYIRLASGCGALTINVKEAFGVAQKSLRFSRMFCHVP